MKPFPPSDEWRLELLLREGSWIESAKIIEEAMGQYNDACLIDYNGTPERLLRALTRVGNKQAERPNFGKPASRIRPSLLACPLGRKYMYKFGS